MDEKPLKKKYQSHKPTSNKVLEADTRLAKIVKTKSMYLRKPKSVQQKLDIVPAMLIPDFMPRPIETSSSEEYDDDFISIDDGGTHQKPFMSDI